MGLERLFGSSCCLVWWSGGCLPKVENTGVWPGGMKVDGDATPLGQRSLSVLPIAYRLWASVGFLHLRDWFRYG